jgi:signal transduction histidine kinase
MILGSFFPVSGILTNFGGTVSYTILGPLILVFMIHRAGLERERQEELKAANEGLRRSEAELERRVAARTRDLKLASDVARRITTVLDLDDLLPILVEQTKNAFGLDFVSIFLFQPENERLVLVAGTDEAGRLMRQERVGFHLNARPSLVAQAARDRQSIVLPDVSAAEAHAKNPHLPYIQSEAVFPMTMGEELVGVLDIQSNIQGRFGLDDEEIFSTLAEQIAIAVKNAQLFETQKQQAEELRKADQTKTQFLASMSHELRTPMNAIINFTEMIALGMIGPVNEDQTELLNQSLDSSKYLLNLINDVLDISKIQAGKLALFVEDDVDLAAELKTAVGMVEPLLSNKPVTLIQDIDNNLPSLSGDKRRIRQIVLNLLTNAAKFTDEGSITFSVKKKDNDILMAVADTGPGISEELQALIFEPFTQTESGLKHAEGTGLGLPITMSLVQAHGGRIWLESEPGEGAVFYVTLPLQAVTAN